MKATYKLIGVMFLLVMLVAACGSGDKEDLTPQPMETTEVLPTAEVTQPLATQPEMTEEPTAAATTPATTAEATQPTGAMGEIDCLGAQPGDQVTVMYQWTANEEEKFNTIMAPFVEACGVQIVATTTRDNAVLDTTVKSTPPDIVFWPNLGPLTLYNDKLLDLSVLVDTSNYADFLLETGTLDGTLLAVPVKADIKTIIWYSPAQFEALGYEVPTTLEELEALVEQMVAAGEVPWSTGMEAGAATGWAGTDFIQDLLLAMQGPDYVNGIIDGSVPYNDPGVVEAYQLFFKWASDEAYAIGGSTGTLNTTVDDAILKVFSDPPEALMIKISGFAGENIAKAYPDLEYGVDYDFFTFPGAQGMQGGADFMYVFNASEAAKALIAYITGPVGAQNWAAESFGIVPNTLAEGYYTDSQIEKMAGMLAGASGFTPDIGDTINPPFNEAEWAAIVAIIQGSDIQTELDAVAEVQMEALGK